MTVQEEGRAALRASTFTFIAFAGVMAMGGYALAAQATDSAQDTAASDAANKIVCKPGRAPLGSRLPAARECRTQAQWDDMARQAHEQLGNTQMRGLSGNPPGVQGGG